MVEDERHPEVFICYSHKDAEWRERLETHLRPLQKAHRLDVWSDQRISSGQSWRTEIETAIARARVAVVLVSPDLLASKFVSEVELLGLLTRRSEDGLVVVWVAVSHSNVEFTPLKDIQAAHDQREPLRDMPPARADKVLVKVSRDILAASKPTAPARSPSTVDDAAPVSEADRANSPVRGETFRVTKSLPGTRRKKLKYLLIGAAVGLAASTVIVNRGYLSGKPRVVLVDENFSTVSRAIKYVDNDLIFEKESYDALHDRVTASLGQQPADIIMVDDPWLPELVSKGLIVPIDEGGSQDAEPGLASSFKASTRAVSVVGNKLFAIPLIGDVEVLLYKEESDSGPLQAMLSEKDPLAAIHRHFSSGANPRFAFRGKVMNDVVDIYWELLRTLGTAPREAEPDGSITIDGCASSRALAWMISMVNDRVSDLEDRKLGTEGIIAGFNNNRFSMTIGWPYWLGEVEDAKRANIRTKPLSEKPLMGLWMLAVRADAPHRDAAIGVLKKLAQSHDVQATLMDKGSIPVTLGFQPDDTLHSKFWERNFEDLTHALEEAVPRPRTSLWWSIEKTLGEEVYHRVFVRPDEKDVQLPSVRGKFIVTPCLSPAAGQN